MVRALLKAPVMEEAIRLLEERTISLITATFLCHNYIRWLARNCLFQFPRRGFGGRMASEKISEHKIRFKTSRPNQGTLDSVVNTHLYLAWTACGDGRLAMHLRMLIRRVHLGPLAIIVVPNELTVNGTPNRFEPTNQITRINFVSWS